MTKLHDLLFKLVLAMFSLAFCAILGGTVVAIIGGISDHLSIKEFGADMVLYGLGGFLFTIVVPGSLLRFVGIGTMNK